MSYGVLYKMFSVPPSANEFSSITKILVLNYGKTVVDHWSLSVVASYADFLILFPPFLGPFTHPEALCSPVVQQDFQRDTFWSSGEGFLLS